MSAFYCTIKDHQSEETFAALVFPRHPLSESDIKEIDSLMRLSKNPNIIKPRGILSSHECKIGNVGNENDSLIVVLPIPQCRLLELKEDKREIQRMLMELVGAVHYIHNCGLYNIGISEDNIVMVDNKLVINDLSSLSHDRDLYHSEDIKKLNELLGKYGIMKLNDERKITPTKNEDENRITRTKIERFINPKTNLTFNTRDVVKSLILSCKELYPSLPVIHLFLSCDILFRCFDIPSKLIDETSLVSGVMSLSARLLGYPPQQSINVNKDYQIITHLKGILLDNSIYKCCATKGDLKHCFENIVLSKEHVYCKLTIEDILSSIDLSKEENDDNIDSLTVFQFLET